VRDALYVVGGLAIVVFFIVRQLRSDRFEQRSLIFPIGLGIYGAVILNSTSKHHPVTAASAALLCLSAAASVGFGVIRGRARSSCSSAMGSSGNARRGPRSRDGSACS